MDVNRHSHIRAGQRRLTFAILFSNDLVVLHPQHSPRCKNVDTLWQTKLSFKHFHDMDGKPGFSHISLEFLRSVLAQRLIESRQDGRCGVHQFDLDLWS